MNFSVVFCICYAHLYSFNGANRECKLKACAVLQSFLGSSCTFIQVFDSKSGRRMVSFVASFVLLFLRYHLLEFKISLRKFCIQINYSINVQTFFRATSIMNWR
ncbi:hypothetical protein HN51_046964 [Arachis hypogaea]